jgi:hypothetical protein
MIHISDQGAAVAYARGLSPGHPSGRAYPLPKGGQRTHPRARQSFSATFFRSFRPFVLAEKGLASKNEGPRSGIFTKKVLKKQIRFSATGLSRISLERAAAVVPP